MKNEFWDIDIANEVFMGTGKIKKQTPVKETATEDNSEEGGEAQW